jgi:hypothetical protein
MLLQFTTILVCAANDLPSGPGAMAPNISTSSDGAVILSWLEPVESDRASMQFRFARFMNDQWSEVRTIVAGDRFFANWADLPRVIEMADGSLLASWLEMAGEGTYAYHVMLARSEDEGISWTNLDRAHDDESPTEHGFVSAAVVATHQQTPVFWLDGREIMPEDGDAAEGEHGGGEMQLRTTTVTASGAAEPSTLLDTRVCECCNTAAAMTSVGPIVVYRDRSEQEVRDISFVRWTGAGWSDPAPVARDGWTIDGCPVNGPAIAARGDAVAVAWFTNANDEPRIRIAFSANAGESFDPPVDVAGSAIGRVDMVMDDSVGVFLCWLGTSAPDAAIYLCRATPDGSMISAVKVADVSSARASGFPKIARIGDSEILIVWTDVDENGRATGLRSRTLPMFLLGE